MHYSLDAWICIKHSKVYNAVFRAKKSDIDLKMGMKFNDFLLISNRYYGPTPIVSITKPALHIIFRFFFNHFPFGLQIR